MELTLQEYYDILAGEGLLFKSLGGDDTIAMDDVGSRVADGYTAELLISTSDVDRGRDILDPSGIVLDNFRLNPLFLFEHGKGPNGPLSNPDAILGRIDEIHVLMDSITAFARYQPGLPMVSNIWNLESKGLIPGNSIGWKPLANIRVENGNRHVGTWELIEVSKVLVPLNGKATNRKY